MKRSVLVFTLLGSFVLLASFGNAAHAVATPTALLVQNNAPWLCDGGSTADATALAHDGIVFNTVTSSEFLAMPITQLQNYHEIIFAGDQFTPFYSALGTPLVRIEMGALLGKGVNIVVHAVDRGCGNFWGGSYVFPYFMNVRHALDYDPTDHVVGTGPVVSGVSSPISGNFASHDYLTGLPGRAQVQIENTANYPTYFTFTFGKGTLYASTMTLEFYATGGPGCCAYGADYTTILDNEFMLANA